MIIYVVLSPYAMVEYRLDPPATAAALRLQNSTEGRHFSDAIKPDRPPACPRRVRPPTPFSTTSLQPSLFFLRASFFVCYLLVNAPKWYW